MPSPAVSLALAVISVLHDDIDALQQEVIAEAAEAERLRVVLVRIRDGQCGACKRTADEDGHVDCDHRPRCYWMPVDAAGEARAALANR